MSACYVRVMIDGQEPLEFAVTEFPARIGRSLDCELNVPDGSVSGLHAQLSLDEDGCVVLAGDMARKAKAQLPWAL